MSGAREDEADGITGEAARPAPIYTIGHSTRTADELVALLRAHGVEQLADVRAYPSSRRLPHFAAEPLAERLAADDLVYRHFGALGGRRRPRTDSNNNAWQHAAFRGYADYMETPPFTQALDALLRYADGRKTVVMCAEALWWQCHRRLIADALVARGLPVLHIMKAAEAEPHELTPFARVVDRRVTYPGLLDRVE